MLRSERFDARLSDYERTTVQDDRDVVMIPAGAVCQTGNVTSEHPGAADACSEAYTTALDRGQHQDAMFYARLGCRRYQSASDCRRVGGLPLAMGNQRLAVPANFAAGLEDIAQFVCLSGAQVRSVDGTDVTGRECGCLARQFVLATDPEYAYALEPQARAFFQRIHEPALAVRLYEVACRRLAYPGSCESGRELGRYSAGGSRESAIAKRP